MSRDVRTPSARCLLVAGMATTTTALLEVWLLPHLLGTLRAEGALGFQALLVAGCEAVAAGCIGWLWLLVTVTVRDALRGRTGRSRVPPAVRRLVLAGCGLSLAGGLLVPAHAGTDDPAGASTAQLLVGLPLPDRMTTAQWLEAVTHGSSAVLAGPAPARRSRPDPATAVVRPGDSLWRIAARTLPPGADDAAVDRRWRRIYHANRNLVGPDPDLVRPGQRLVLPPVHPPR